MTGTQKGRLGALAGIGFFALGLLGTIVQPAGPGFAAKPQELAAHYTADGDAILAGSSLYLLGSVLLLWFVSALRARLASAAGDPDDGLATVAYAGGVAGATLCMAAAAANAMGALRADERGAIDPQVATVLADLGNILYGLAAPMAFAALVLAVAIAALRTRFLPAWFGVVSVVLGVGLALPPVNYALTVPFIIWVAVTGALLVLASQTQTMRAPVPATT